MVKFRVRLALRGGVALVDRVPVDGVEPGGEIVGALVLILEVVGMLPDINAENRGLALHQRGVLVRGAGDAQAAIGRGDQPGPAAAEAPRTGGRDLLLEGVV